MTRRFEKNLRNLGKQARLKGVRATCASSSSLMTGFWENIRVKWKKEILMQSD